MFQSSNRRCLPEWRRDKKKKELPAKKVDDHVSDPSELAPLLDYSGYENHRPLDRVKDGPWVKVIKLFLFVTDKQLRLFHFHSSFQFRLN
jgi:hypothetical protein